VDPGPHKLASELFVFNAISTRDVGDFGDIYNPMHHFADHPLILISE
jgi:hypothetical protein